MANYPGSIPSSSPATHTVVNDEIVAIATAVGTSPAGSYTDVKSRLDAAQRRPGGAVGYTTGRYYTAGTTGSTTTQALTANRLYAEPFWVSKNATFTKLGISVTTAGAASTKARLGVYDCDTNGLPNNLVIDGGADLAVDAIAGVENTGLTIALKEGGLYYLAIVSNGTPTLRATTGSATPAFGLASLTGANIDFNAYQALTFTPGSTTMPSTFSATPTYASSNHYVVRIGL